MPRLRGAIVRVSPCRSTQCCTDVEGNHRLNPAATLSPVALTPGWREWFMDRELQRGLGLAVLGPFLTCFGGIAVVMLRDLDPEYGLSWSILHSGIRRLTACVDPAVSWDCSTHRQEAFRAWPAGWRRSTPGVQWPGLDCRPVDRSGVKAKARCRHQTTRGIPFRDPARRFRLGGGSSAK